MILHRESVGFYPNESQPFEIGVNSPKSHESVFGDELLARKVTLAPRSNIVRGAIIKKKSAVLAATRTWNLRGICAKSRGGLGPTSSLSSCS